MKQPEQFKTKRVTQIAIHIWKLRGKLALQCANPGVKFRAGSIT